MSYLEQDLEAGAVAADLRLEGSGESRTLSLRAGRDTSRPGEVVAGGPAIARAWPGDGAAQGHDYLARLDLQAPLATQRVIVSARAPLVLRGLSLVDARTGAHVSVTLSKGGDVRRIHSGDVKLYERTSAPGRAWLVHRAALVSTDAAALAQLGEGGSDPRHEAVLDLSAAGIPEVAALPSLPGDAAAGDELVTLAYRGESAAWRVRTAHAALLVVSDAYYPGWQAEVDGRAAPVLRANLMFRAVPVPAGEHEVTMRYAPASWRAGLIISVATCILLLAALAATLWPRPGPGATHQTGAM